MNRREVLLAAAVCGYPLPTVVHAQVEGYPAKPVRFIVAFPPGGPNDILARLVAQRISERLGQPVVVDNRPGAAGNIGTAAAAQAPGDGYTIVLGATSTMAVNQYLYPSLGYDPKKDFVPVALLAAVPNVLVANASVPAGNWANALAFMKATPRGANFGSPGSGTTSHIITEIFAAQTQVKLTHVPYKGDVPMYNDLIGGQIQFAFPTVISAIPFIQGGRVRPISVTSEVRSPALPNVPTVTELGLPQLTATTWFGVFATAGTPPAVVKLLNDEVNRALGSPDVKAQLEKLGIPVKQMSLSAFQQFVEDERQRWGDVVKKAGIKLD